MRFTRPAELLEIKLHERVLRGELSELIQFSKVPSSTFWAGPEWRIGNTPQQGINWIGELPATRGVLIRTVEGKYRADGWVGSGKGKYHYGLKARKGRINRAEKANAVLIRQPEIGYPVFLFTEDGDYWLFEGWFQVVSIHDSYVVLERFQ